MCFNKIKKSKKKYRMEHNWKIFILVVFFLEQSRSLLEREIFAKVTLSIHIINILTIITLMNPLPTTLCIWRHHCKMLATRTQSPSLSYAELPYDSRIQCTLQFTAPAQRRSLSCAWVSNCFFTSRTRKNIWDCYYFVNVLLVFLLKLFPYLILYNFY